MERIILSSFKDVSRQGTDGIYTPVYKTVEKAVKETILWGVIDEAIALKVDQFSETQDFVQHFIGRLVAEPTFTVPITNMMRRQAGKVAAREVKLSKQFGRQVSLGGEDNTPPSSRFEKSQEPCKQLIVRQEPRMEDESCKAPERRNTAGKTDGNTKESYSSCSRMSCSKSRTDESDK